jgi:23S rRNA (guanosine2251-2'-O)-methyltransferase
MFLYGLHSVGARLRHHPQSVSRLFCVSTHAQANSRINALAQLARQGSIAVEWISAERLSGLIPRGVNHQGVICECESIAERYLSLEDLLQQHESSPLLLLALDQVHDPHNLGACLRSADAFGAQAVIIPKDRSAGLSEAVSRSAVGAAETVPLIVVTNFSRALAMLAESRVAVTGLAGEATTILWDFVPHARQCWVLGGEAQGLRRLSRAHCDSLLQIPMQGAVESLNVSVCAAICLAHSAKTAWQQRQLP